LTPNKARLTARNEKTASPAKACEAVFILYKPGKNPDSVRNTLCLLRIIPMAMAETSPTMTQRLSLDRVGALAA
jgi:hypothetical protein